MVDFTEIITVAQELITENGRSITLVAFNSTPQDPARPWLGPTDPRAKPDSTLTLDAVFVHPSSATALGLSQSGFDLLKTAEQIAIASPGATADLSVFQEVIDGTTRWKIEKIETLRPGREVVLAFIAVKR